MKSTKCGQCGFVGWSDQYCKACGASLDIPNEHSEQAEGQEKGLAILALVLGIVSVLTFGLLGVGAIVGIIISAKAMKRVSREPWRYGGRGMAIAGLVLNITPLSTLVLLLLIAAISIPNLFAASMAANEASAVDTLRQISAAEGVYYRSNNKFATLEELATQDFIDSKLATGTRNGYKFTVELTTDEANSDGFAVACVPLTYGSSGRRSFFIDESFVIRGSDNHGAPSSKMDTPINRNSDYPSTSRRAEYRPEGVY